MSDITSYERFREAMLPAVAALAMENTVPGHRRLERVGLSAVCECGWEVRRDGWRHKEMAAWLPHLVDVSGSLTDAEWEAARAFYRLAGEPLCVVQHTALDLWRAWTADGGG